MKVLTVDYSFAKSGWAVMDLSSNKAKVIDQGMIETDKDSEPIERIDYTIRELDKLYKKHAVDLIIKEGAIVGSRATGTPVLKAHGALEFYCYNKLIPLEEMHNATMKAFARNYLKEKNYTKEEIKKLGNKLIVAEFLKLWYNRDMSELYTPRGRYLEDIGDAYLIGIVYKDKKL